MIGCSCEVQNLNLCSWIRSWRLLAAAAAAAAMDESALERYLEDSLAQVGQQEVAQHWWQGNLCAAAMPSVWSLMKFRELAQCSTGC